MTNKKSVELFDIVLYSRLEKVQYLAVGLNSQESRDYMNSYTPEVGTMIGYIPHHNGGEDDRV
jgi:hypothetical protein